MYNATEILIDSFNAELRKGYRRMYGHFKHDYEEIICWCSSMALENIANSDALYHNVEHTILVTLVGQEVFRGVHIREGGVTPEDWLNSVISLLCHDIGFVKGVCRNDQREQNLFATGNNDELVEVSAGHSDAILNPYHVARSKLFLKERFGNHRLINAEVICKNVELTRFPVPNKNDLPASRAFPSLIRAADLIGQLSDPRYLLKTNALFYEFEEIGMNKMLGYKKPGDLKKNYPAFFWANVNPYITDALMYLSLSQFGQQIIASLYTHVFMVEHSLLDRNFPQVDPGNMEFQGIGQD